MRTNLPVPGIEYVLRDDEFIVSKTDTKGRITYVNSCAGERGRGLAVVASEVRSLAQRSAGAAKEIKALFGNLVDQVGQGNLLVDDAGRTMREVVGSVQRATGILADFTTASAEQTRGIAEINRSQGELDSLTQQNARMVGQHAGATAQLASQGAQLSRAVGVFQLGDKQSRRI